VRHSITVAIFILLLVAGVQSGIAQPIYYGWYLKPAISEEFISLDVGFWVPFLEELPISARGGAASCYRCPAFRIGLGSAMEQETDDFEERIHLEGGVGWERGYLLLGPYFSFGDAARANWGVRIASGLHLSDYLSLELSSEISSGRSPRLTGGCVVTF
jgi:hypothetical protein